MRLVFLGPPGVGKGTQAAVIAQKLDIPAIATGDMLRAAVESGSDLGRKVHGYMAAGELVPDDVIIACVRERLSEPDANKGFLLDGFPRTPGQAQALEDMLNGQGTPLDAAVALEAPEEVIVERLGGRMTCANCGAIYHASHNPPAKADLCDKCGGALTIREDDRPEAIRRRLAVYHEKTEPVMDYYRMRGLLVSINGGADRETVTRSIEAALKK